MRLLVVTFAIANAACGRIGYALHDADAERDGDADLDAPSDATDESDAATDADAVSDAAEDADAFDATNDADADDRAPEVLVPFGSTFRYFDQDHVPAPDWFTEAYDDSSWAAGPAPLGYDSDDGVPAPTTVISYGPDVMNKYRTAYFRHVFTTGDPAGLESMRFTFLVDDGVIVYLNGAEQLRFNMPVGAVTFDDPSADFIAGCVEGIPIVLDVADTSLLRAGDNVLAIELHNQAGASSDAFLDLELVAYGAAGPPDDTRARLLVPSDPWRYLDDGSSPMATWASVPFDDSTWATGPGPLGYGRGDEGTVVDNGGDPMNVYVTTYFRTTFDLPAELLGRMLLLRSHIDDGAVLYLNGVEFWRPGIASGTVLPSTLSTATIEGIRATLPCERTLPPARLREGSNTLAVEVHQTAVTSSDIRLDLELIVE